MKKTYIKPQMKMESENVMISLLTASAPDVSVDPNEDAIDPSGFDARFGDFDFEED